MRVSWPGLVAALAAGLAVLPGAAQAQDRIAGLYIGIAAGAGLRQETGLSGLQALTHQVAGVAGPRNGMTNNRLQTLVGPAGAVAMGYGFGNGLRVELEGTGRTNQVDSLRLDGRTLVGAHGSVGAFGPMGNLLYDIPLGGVLGIPLSLTLGGGAGYLMSDWHKAQGILQANNTVDGANASRWSFAWQAIGGLALELDRISPGLSLTAEYRYLQQTDPSVKGSAMLRSTGTTVQGRFRPQDNINQSVLVGLRYAFGNNPAAVPPPSAPTVTMAPPAPLPMPVTRTFIVYFPYNGAALDAAARQVVAEAVEHVRRGGVSRLDVTGHTDRAGTDAFNQRLSARRAEVVAAELASRGINRAAMTVAGLGESAPAVPTADGMKEPRNRRVEVVAR